jgi:glyoxylase-like metal-dependent hydrolase (beta-lactamase superfamily II)
MKTRTTFFILYLAFTSILLKAQVKDSIYKVTDNVYVITGYTCNISFLVTNDGVVLFDTGNQPDSGKRIMSLVRSVTDKPLKNIFITHYHYDHVNGLATLPGNVPIIAQRNEMKNIKNREDATKKELEQVKRETDSIKNVIDKMISKDVTYAKTDSLYKTKLKKLNELTNTKYIYATELIDTFKRMIVGKDTLEMFYPGKCHTDGDLVIYIKSKNVMVLGDLLFTKSNPFMDPTGEVQNWAKQLKTLADKNVKFYIPGHQQVATSSDLWLMVSYFTDMYNAIGEMKKSGKTLAEIKKSLSLPAYDSFQFAFFREQNIEAIYNQVK